jgi:hypothetical protein
MAQRNGLGALGGNALGSPSMSTGDPMYNGENAQGNSFGQNQMVGVQGTGVNPATPTQTGGFQYGLSQQPGAIQGSVQNNAVNTQGIQAAQMPVSSVQAGSPYVQNAQDAYYNQATSRLDPQWQQRQESLEGQLANMGLTRGSEAWNREMSNMSQGRNDAYSSAMNQAIMNSGAEAQRLQGMDLASGTFANQAAQQNFANQGQAQQWQNAALGQEFGQGLQQGAFANQAQNQGFTQGMGQAQLNNTALQNQQAAAQGWGQQATQRYGADQSMAGQVASANASAGGQMAAAESAANASMANAQMNAALQARQIANAEQMQNFNMSRTAAYDVPGLQNAYMQGMSPTGAPQYNNYNTMQPTTQNSAGYVNGLTGAQNQQGQGLSNILGSFAGFLP